MGVPESRPQPPPASGAGCRNRRRRRPWNAPAGTGAGAPTRALMEEGRSAAPWAALEALASVAGRQASRPPKTTGHAALSGQGAQEPADVSWAVGEAAEAAAPTASAPRQKLRKVKVIAGTPTDYPTPGSKTRRRPRTFFPAHHTDPRMRLRLRLRAPN
jgi:hypothetical protein